MVKADLNSKFGTDNRQDASATKRDDYRAPKLTEVGTVHDLTLGVGNEGARDTPFQTQGGG